MTRTNIFAAAGFSLALVFTASCTTDDGEENETLSSSSLGAGGTSSDSGSGGSGTLCVDDEEKQCILLSYVRSLGAQSCADFDGKAMNTCPTGYETITSFGSGGACIYDMAPAAPAQICVEGKQFLITPEMCEELNEDAEEGEFLFVYAPSCPPNPGRSCDEVFPYNVIPHLLYGDAAMSTCEFIYNSY